MSISRLEKIFSLRKLCDNTSFKDCEKCKLYNSDIDCLKFGDLSLLKEKDDKDDIVNRAYYILFEKEYEEESRCKIQSFPVYKIIACLENCADEGCHYCELKTLDCKYLLRRAAALLTKASDYFGDDWVDWV